MSKPRLSGGVASPAVRLLGLGVLLAIAAASAGQQDGEQRERERPPGAASPPAPPPPLSSITDEFHPLPQGGFLVTMMGGATGHAPGRVAELDRPLALVAEHPANPPADGFNPHGIAVRPEVNLMVTSDFICPATTLNATAGSLDLRGSVRVWD